MPSDKKSLSSQLWVSISVNKMETWTSNGPASSAAVHRLANPMYKVRGGSCLCFQANQRSPKIKALGLERSVPAQELLGGEASVLLSNVRIGKRVGKSPGIIVPTFATRRHC